METSPDFESIKQTNIYGIEFWSARDLAPLLGYIQWRRFEDAIKRAKVSCETNGDSIQNHFVGTGKMVAIGSRAEREVNDYALTRYACYLIAQNGDPRKPEIAAAQAYFIISTRAHEMQQLREEQEKRIVMRLKVSESHKQLAEVAYQSGVNSETFGIFVDAGYLGLHHHTVSELKTRKGIPDHEDYLDNITREELSAIDFKNVQTEAKLKRDPVNNLDEASQTHYFIGNQVRKAIEAMHAPMPEDLPPAASIRKMVEERRRASKKHKRVKQAPQDEQGTLF